MNADQQESRFYIKYYPDQQKQAIELVAGLALSLIDTFSDQHVLVVEGQPSVIEPLNEHPSIEYIEPVPEYSLMSPSIR